MKTTNRRKDHKHFALARLPALLPILVALASPAVAAPREPFKLHPQNPHYFLWRDQATILITSAEHYGAVLNLDFDYVKYLDALARDKLNNTRTFTGGAYVEPQGAFNIARNTLAPAANRYITPWLRSNQPGYAGGGNKFDLSAWDEAYFKRLLDFVQQAGQRGIVVEVNLFCPMYEEMQWKLSPFNIQNNVNSVGNIGRTNVYTLDKHGELLAIQEKMTRRIVEDLREFDNIYYEICNEPYFGGVTIEWQHHIADVITDAQKNHPHPKLISQNIANNSTKVEKPHPHVSVLNFHYAAPPETVGINYHLNRVIGDNETGFRGTNDAPYRMEGWDFLIAGGALFNHLDYSFTVGHEDGTFVYPASQPGGGNPDFRRQMRILRDFIYSFDFVKMKPDNTVIQRAPSAGLTARALVEPGRAYAIYLRPNLVTQFSARWTGQIQPRYSEEYTFHTFSNDGARLWIDNKPLINDWTEHGEQETTGRIQLEANRKYDLKLEYFYNGGMAAMKLWWSSPSQKKEPIPSSALWLPGGSGHGLKGEYFAGPSLDRPWHSREDSEVNFAWADKPPFPAPKVEGETRLAVQLPSGSYTMQWLDPVTGKTLQDEKFQHSGGNKELTAPGFSEDIALKILRQ